MKLYELACSQFPGCVIIYLCPAELDPAGEAYAARLRRWIAATAQAVAARARLLPLAAEA